MSLAKPLPQPVTLDALAESLAQLHDCLDTRTEAIAKEQVAGRMALAKVAAGQKLLGRRLYRQERASKEAAHDRERIEIKVDELVDNVGNERNGAGLYGRVSLVEQKARASAIWIDRARTVVIAFAFAAPLVGALIWFLAGDRVAHAFRVALP